MELVVEGVRGGQLEELSTVVDDNYPGRRIDSSVLLPVLTRCLT